MNLFNSIRWRLQLWYGVILVLVLTGLGAAAYDLARSRLYRQADQGILHRVSVIANTLHNPQGRPPPRRGQEGDFAPPNGPDDPAGLGGPDRPNGPPEEGMDRPQNRRQPFRPENFRLQPRDQSLFDAADANSFYYVIFSRDGDEVIRSTNAPAGVKPPPLMASSESTNSPPGRLGSAPGGTNPTPWTRGSYREAGMVTPPGEAIVVGRSITPELTELRRTGFALAGVGGIILLIGLAGGAWLVTLAIKPVASISATAVKISAGDLSQRIDIAETESELGQLAAVLNATFARLETAFAQQRQFAADAAHELRTPVSVILTQTQMALGRERSAEDYKQTVEACQRAAQRMRRLIESLLELARYDAGQETLNRQSLDLAATVTECIELVGPMAEAASLKLIAELASIEINGDAGRLSQVVTNLLTNAIQYNRPAGEVRVKLERQSGLAVLSVTDTGQGIAPEDLPRVFERFYRADKSRTGGSNAGLGLSICKSIVEAHGGTLEATSEPGTGTTFTLRLPA